MKTKKAQRSQQAFDWGKQLRSSRGFEAWWGGG